MKKLFLALFLLFSRAGYCQSIDADAIRQHAFDFGRLDTIDTRVVDIFRSQRLVLVGEMHGTAEPAKFVYYLVRNLFGHGRKICVGLEISPQDMLSTEELYDSAALSISPFFHDVVSGKDSKAWFSLIRNVSQLNDVELFYFDLNKKQLAKNASHVDSLMYVNIKAKMMEDTDAIYICLTGSNHNKLTDGQFPVPMGNYFLKDRQLNLNLENMVSFNHRNVEGSVNLNTGEGLRMHTIKNSDYFYNITNMRNYFSFTHQLIDNEYNGVLFTYHVTASFGLR